jgi:hypothetical protein
VSPRASFFLYLEGSNFVYFTLFCFTLFYVLLGNPSWRWTHYIAQAALKLMMFLPQPPECWHYRNISPCLAILEWIKIGFRPVCVCVCERERERSYTPTLHMSIISFSNCHERLGLFHQAGLIKRKVMGSPLT